MAVVFKNVKFNNNMNLYLDSNKIIGVMGVNYSEFFKLLSGSDIYVIDKENNFFEKKVSDELLKCYQEKSYYSFDEIVNIITNRLSLSKDFINKNIKELTNREKRIVKYLKMLLINPKIIVIDEPYLYLDYDMKKKIRLLIKEIIKESKKTIVIGSCDSNIIYELSQKVMLINYNSYLYSDTQKVFENIMVLNDYNIDEPEIVRFIRLAREKGINIDYTNDIRDLIKEVYKNV